MFPAFRMFLAPKMWASQNHLLYLSSKVGIWHHLAPPITFILTILRSLAQSISLIERKIELMLITSLDMEGCLMSSKQVQSMELFSKTI